MPRLEDMAAYKNRTSIRRIGCQRCRRKQAVAEGFAISGFVSCSEHIFIMEREAAS